jgi:glycine cleavage system transcriptional repressor
MQKNVVFTVTGFDRPGVVESVTRYLLEYDGNVEISKMARLGGVFAMLMLVSLPESRFEKLEEIIKMMVDAGYTVTAKPTERWYGKRYPGWQPFQIEVEGADHEGIIHHIAQYLSERGINIESMDTYVKNAPMSGTQIFSMQARLFVPPEQLDRDWQDDLEQEGSQLSVDIDITASQ